MANPRGNLAGYTDPSDPQWRERLMEALTVRQTAATGRRRPPHRRPGRVDLYIGIRFLSLLHEAARQRDISVAAYGRRAVAAFVAKDLGLDWTELLAECAEPLPYGQIAPTRFSNGRTVDDGTGHGDWKI